MVEAGFGQKPNLCRSAEIDATPGRRKSNAGIGRPISAANGAIQPPTHASTCSQMPRATASSDKAAIGSMVPQEKHGTEPTSIMVFSSATAATAAGTATNSA